MSGTGYYRQLMEKLPPEGGGGRRRLRGDRSGSRYGPTLGRLELLKGACARRELVRFTYCAPTGTASDGGTLPPGVSLVQLVPLGLVPGTGGFPAFQT
ncbi:MAG: hypothetical protein ACLUHL_09915 [Dysosmobacter welbionis]